jgi:DNA invertase Pin-like site-specific DNA recombinase
MGKIEIRPKAYSYIRMSTERQISGDSLRRQLQASREYAAEHGLDLDETLRDIGVSAYTGANVENGALGKFLQLVKTNQIAQGSYLIVESLDRLSRKNVLEALPPFLAIINAGIIVVTLADKQVYSQDIIQSNPYQLMGSLVVMIRANDESATKSKRIKEAMSKMREAAMRGEGRYNINLPSWIEATKGPRGEITYSLNAHAETVKLIYELAAEGVGQMEICRMLHKRNIPPFKRAKLGWHQSAVSYLLSSPAVYGTYQPREHRNGKYQDAGPAQHGFFPAAIDETLYLKAQQAKRRPPHKGPKGKDFSNLFVSMIECDICQGPMTLYYGRKKEQKYLRCYNRMRTFKRYGEEKKQFQCTNGKSIKYTEFEKAVLDAVPEYKLHEVFRAGNASADATAIAKRLVQIQSDLMSLEQKNASLIEEMSSLPKNLRHLVVAQLNNNSEILSNLEKEQAELQAQHTAIRTADKASTDIEKQIDEERSRWPVMTGEDLYRSRVRVHTAYKKFVQMIYFNPESQETTLVIANGFKAFKFKNGSLVAKVDAVADGHVTGKPGGMEYLHFASDLSDPIDIAERIEIVERIHARQR